MKTIYNLGVGDSYWSKTQTAWGEWEPCEVRIRDSDSLEFDSIEVYSVKGNFTLDHINSIVQNLVQYLMHEMTYALHEKVDNEEVD